VGHPRRDLFSQGINFIKRTSTLVRFVYHSSPTKTTKPSAVIVPCSSNPQIFFALKGEQTLGPRLHRTSSHSRLLMSCSFLVLHTTPITFRLLPCFSLAYFSLYFCSTFSLLFFPSSLCQLLYHGSLSFRRVTNATRHFTSIYSHPNAKIASPI